MCVIDACSVRIYVRKAACACAVRRLQNVQEAQIYSHGQLKLQTNSYTANWFCHSESHHSLLTFPARWTMNLVSLQKVAKS